MHVFTKKSFWLILSFCFFAFLLLLAGCTRFEDHAELSRDAQQEWHLTWHTLARRGLNFVDSSGNVGSATVRFRCQADPARPLVWTVNGAATRWSGSDSALKRLGPQTKTNWRGSVTLEKTGNGHALIIDLRDEQGRSFIGNRRFENAQGNGETWYAQ